MTVENFVFATLSKKLLSLKNLVTNFFFHVSMEFLLLRNQTMKYLSTVIPKILPKVVIRQEEVQKIIRKARKLSG